MIFWNQWVTTQGQLPHLMLLLLATLISCYFDILTSCLITVFTSHKDVSSIRVFNLYTCVFFVIFFFLYQSQKVISLTKSLLKINWQLKPINSRIRNSLSDQMLIFKNWSVYFSLVLGYVRFHQPHDNKKLWFSITYWTNGKQGASNRVASCYLELLDKLEKRICKTVDSSLATSLELLADRLNVASLSLFCRYYFGRCSS